MLDKTIAVDARHLKSGIGTYLKNLVPKLTEELPCRWRIIGPDDWRFLENDRITWLSCREPIYTIREHAVVPRLAKPADLLWVPQYNAPLLWNEKCVITLHDLIHRMPRFTPPSLKTWLSGQLMHRSLKRAARVITVSHYSKQKLNSFFPGFDEKIVVIANGVQKIPRNETKPEISEPYILSFGNALPHKNFKGLLGAFQKLLEEIPHYLVLAGPPGRDFEKIKKIADDIGSRVILLGEQSGEEFARLMTHASLYVCPSFEEGFGLPPLEALSMGVTVAAAQASSLPEVLQEGAFWFDPEDPQNMAMEILRALKDSEERQKVVQAGKERVRHHTWEKSVQSHAQLFREVLAE